MLTGFAAYVKCKFMQMFGIKEFPNSHPSRSCQKQQLDKNFGHRPSEFEQSLFKKKFALKFEDGAKTFYDTRLKPVKFWRYTYSLLLFVYFI
jgi:hypothetical protein